MVDRYRKVYISKQSFMSKIIITIIFNNCYTDGSKVIFIAKSM